MDPHDTSLRQATLKLTQLRVRVGEIAASCAKAMEHDYNQICCVPLPHLIRRVHDALISPELSGARRPALRAWLRALGRCIEDLLRLACAIL